MYNRYHGNSGVVERIREEHHDAPPPAPTETVHAGHFEERRPRREGLPPLHNMVSELFSNVVGELETEDLILMLMLYLLYRESGDEELLIMLGALFLL